MRRVLGYSQYIKPKNRAFLRYAVLDFGALIGILRAVPRLHDITVVRYRHAQVPFGERIDILRRIDAADIRPDFQKHRFAFSQIFGFLRVRILAQITEDCAHHFCRRVEYANAAFSHL